MSQISINPGDLQIGPFLSIGLVSQDGIQFSLCAPGISATRLRELADDMDRFTAILDDLRTQAPKPTLDNVAPGISTILDDLFPGVRRQA